MTNREGEKNGRSKLNWDKVKELREYYFSFRERRGKRFFIIHDSLKNLAKENRVAVSTLRSALIQETWK